MTDREFQDLLLDTIRARSDDGADDEVVHVRTYDEVGLMTNDSGLVVVTKDGSEFQVTIVQTAGAR